MEYANTRIFKLKRAKKIDLKKVKKELEKYRETGKVSKVFVDNDYNIIRNAEAYIAGKKLGLKYLESARLRFMKKPTSKFPNAFLLEITNRCTFCCRMCPRNYLTREEKDMGMKIFKKIIHEIGQHDIEGLWLYNIGEPMLHPEFPELLKFVNKYKKIHPLWLSTNGSTLDEKNSKLLLESDVDYLNFSLNALDKKTHKIISRESYFPEVMKNLNDFLAMKKKMKRRKPFLRLQIIDQPEVHDQVEKFIEEWGPQADIISINILESFAGEKEIPSNEHLKKKDEKMMGVCTRVDRGFFYIFSNNKVGICATDYNCVNCVGDVSKNTVEEIWQGNTYKTMFKDIKEQKYDKVPFCYRCQDRKLA